MDSWRRASFPVATGTLRRIASFNRSCNSPFFPKIERPLFLNSSFNSFIFSAIIVSIVSCSVACAAGGGPSTVSSNGSSKNSTASSSCLSAKNGSPPSESYPSSFDCEFWLKKRFCTIGIVDGKMDPLAASTRSGPSSPSSGPDGKPTLKRTLEGGGVVFVSSAWPPSPRKSPSPPALLSGSDAKNSIAKLSTFALNDAVKFDVADAMVPAP